MFGSPNISRNANDPSQNYSQKYIVFILFLLYFILVIIRPISYSFACAVCLLPFYILKKNYFRFILSFGYFFQQTPAAIVYRFYSDQSLDIAISKLAFLTDLCPITKIFFSYLQPSLPFHWIPFRQLWSLIYFVFNYHLRTFFAIYFQHKAIHSRSSFVSFQFTKPCSSIHTPLLSIQILFCPILFLFFIASY